MLRLFFVHQAVLLMDKFIYYLKQHRLYTRTFGII
jgi:hypothetical protein